MAEHEHAGEEPLAQVHTRTLVPPPGSRRAPWLGWLLVALVLLAAGGWWWWQQGEPQPTPPPPVGAAEPAPAPPVEQASAPAASAALPEPPVTLGPLEAAQVPQALTALFGAQGMKLVIADDFIGRFVATVDNLGREHAAPRLWPVRPTEGRFRVIERNGRSVIDPDNALRYTPLVLLAEQVDAASVVALYGRMLPLLQPAYEQLGYPGQRFHARLVATIDHLLAAPDVPELIPVTLVEVRGEVASERPWQRYEFADPRLQAASAGQKMMMRVGAANERRLKARLRALRDELKRQAQR